MTMSSIPGRLRARLTRFDGSSEADALLLDLPFDGPNRVEADFRGGRWEIEPTLDVAAGTTAGTTIEGLIRFRLAAGHASETAVALEWEVTPWSQDVYVLVPAAAYNGNRYPCRPYAYPPMVHEPGDIGPNAPVLVTDVPRLAAEPQTPSSMQLRTGDAATPCIGFYDPETRRAGILLTEQGGALGDHGLAVIESAARDSAVLRVEAPGVRRETLYRSCKTSVPSWDRGAEWTEGTDVEIRYRIYLFEADEVQTLFDRLLSVRRDLSGPVTLAHELPFSAAWKIVEAKYHRENWCDEGYFRVGTHEAAEESRFQDWQTGWVGGGMVPFPMLIAGDARSRDRALANIAWMFETAQLPAGFFHAVRHRGVAFGDGFGVPGTGRWYMVRKQADALYFLAKTLTLLEADSRLPSPPGSWRDGVRLLADTLCATVARSGELGQYLDCETGGLVVDGSTAAAIAPAALALTGAFLGEARYVETAAKLARTLDDRDVRSGVTTGGPGEILKCPDSESAFAMLESFVVLFEVTGEAHWVARAKAMAAQCATWCHSYDFAFPAESWFARLGMRTTGSVWANVQNKHSAPGICTLSGDSLFKLFRATGDQTYLELIRETAHNLTQYMSRKDRQVGDPGVMRPGYICERVNTSDWEGLQNVGGSLFGSCWPEVSLMLTTVEIPGLYVQPDVGFHCVFDHLETGAVKRQGNTAALSVRNPTAFDAQVRVFSEHSSRAREPLGQAAALAWPVIDIPAGATREIVFNAETGRVTLPEEEISDV